MLGNYPCNTGGCCLYEEQTCRGAYSIVKFKCLEGSLTDMKYEKAILDYEDIIHLPHPTSKIHPRMSLQDRAAQFSPFAALTGHEEAIEETARLTEVQLELDEDTKILLNERLQQIRENLTKVREDLEGPLKVRITYFLPDEQKSGGEYVSCTGFVKKIDDYGCVLVMEEGTVVPIWRIKEIEMG